MNQSEYEILNYRWEILRKGIVQLIFHVRKNYHEGGYPEKHNKFVKMYKKLLNKKTELTTITPWYNQSWTFCTENLDKIGPEIDELIEVCEEEFNIKLKTYRQYKLSNSMDDFYFSM